MARRRRWLATGIFVSVVLVSGTTAIASATVSSSSSSSDKALAKEIDLQRSDLPKSMQWTSSTPSVPAQEISDSKRAITCIRAGGGIDARVSPDVFGTVGEVSGDDTVDVLSPTFGEKGSFTGLPSASSDVVFSTSTEQALNDLAAFDTKTPRTCQTRLVAEETALQSGGSVKDSSSTPSLPHHGEGNGGVHYRFMLSGGDLPATLYDDTYFYVQGRVEISITFVDLGSPFPANWASSISTAVMQRAQSILR